jgi:hypothetical protein
MPLLLWAACNDLPSADDCLEEKPSLGAWALRTFPLRGSEGLTSPTQTTRRGPPLAGSSAACWGEERSRVFDGT